MMTNKLGVYLHIPFCARRCDYCDFISYCAGEDAQRRYVADLLREASLYGDILESYRVETVYFGGGTPSVLPFSLLRELLEGLPRVLFRAKEITFEMNPESVRREKLDLLRSHGVNRISLGIQSLRPQTLKVLGRIHSAEAALQAVRWVREAGFDNLNVDLMYAIGPEHPVESTLKGVLELAPEHISTYPLELYPHRPLAQKLAPAEEELSLREFSYLKESLERAGYTRYEVSNFALPGYASVHNSAYWKRTEYLGLGAGAHSLIRETRRSNTGDLEEYHRRLSRFEKPAETCSRLTLSEQAFETLMLGLRLSEGVETSVYREKYGDFTAAQKQSIARLREQGLLLADDRRLRLSERGMDLMNLVLLSLME